MKNQIALFLVIVMSNITFSQNLLKKDLLKSNWIIDIENWELTKLDTLTLVKMSNYKSSLKSLSEGHVKTYYYYKDDIKDMEITTLHFGKNDDLFIDSITSRFCRMLSPIENWKWKLDENSQTLSITLNEKQTFHYRIIEKIAKKGFWDRDLQEDGNVTFEADLVILKIVKN